uniref:AlNc14C579G12204 protein n=1 Tax=Albugo laibachii Nc14 TaxID=890382 RepID=F0X1B4_9STRA|nr:AlNc14C579G12204 [Albugo laibachii Nc14]|eukprot:CCA27589.1 AlNc14C579G12204 [Albugo laibachii Nc14]
MPQEYEVTNVPLLSPLQPISLKAITSIFGVPKGCKKEVTYVDEFSENLLMYS